MKTARILLAAFFFFEFAPAGAQLPPSNLQFLQAALRACAAGPVATLAAAPDSLIVIAREPAGAESPTRLLQTALTEIIRAQNRQGVFDRETVSRKGIAVNYAVMQAQLTYSRLPGGWLGWLRTARAQRSAQVAVDFDIHHEATGEIYFQGLVQIVHRDTVQTGQIAGLENTAMPMTVGRWVERERTHRWLEPAVLVAATGAIVYAFYSLRSQ